MAKMIREIDEQDGLPTGTYDVIYYELLNGHVRRTSMDASVSDGRINTISLTHDEAAHMICRSQSGGAWLYGSARMRDAMRAYRQQS